MSTTAEYNREIKKAYVSENGYQIAEYDFNSCEFDSEIKMNEIKANKCLSLMEQAKADDEYFVSMED